MRARPVVVGDIGERLAAPQREGTTVGGQRCAWVPGCFSIVRLVEHVVELPGVDLETVVAGEREPRAVGCYEVREVAVAALGLQRSLEVGERDAQALTGVGRVGPEVLGNSLASSPPKDDQVGEELSDALTLEVGVVVEFLVTQDAQRSEHLDA